MGAVVSRGELSGPKDSGERQGPYLLDGESGSLWIPWRVPPVWGSGEAETLIDPPNPPVSARRVRGRATCYRGGRQHG